MSTQTASGLSLRTDSLTSLHWLGIALAVITGILHLVLGVALFSSQPTLGASFVVAAIGYAAGIAGVLVDYRRVQLYVLGALWTLGQIVAYFAVNWPDVVSPIGIGDKVVQVVLIGVLAVLYSRES
jgi:hypothetical protein